MIEHVWSILCARSIVDQATKSLSLIDIIEGVTLGPEAELPVKIPLSFVLVTLWTRAVYNEPAKGTMRVTLFSPSGIQKDVAEEEIDLTQYVRLRHNIAIQGFEVPELGRYVFQVDMIQESGEEGSQTVAKIPFDIRKVKD